MDVRDKQIKVIKKRSQIIKHCSSSPPQKKQKKTPKKKKFLKLVVIFPADFKSNSSYSTHSALALIYCSTSMP